MCTLIVAHRALPDIPLLVADNRDERLDRPEEPARWWSPEPGGPRIWSPRDARAGGTWIGWSERGIFAGLTNRFGSPPDLSRRSRGEVVLEALMHSTAEAAARTIAGWSPQDINPFHLLVCDLERAFLVWHDGSALRQRELEAGIHVLTERSLGAAESERESFVRAQVELLRTRGELNLHTLATLLASPHRGGFDDVRVHLPALNYGTRSSVLMQLEHAQATPQLIYKPLGYTLPVKSLT